MLSNQAGTRPAIGDTLLGYRRDGWHVMRHDQTAIQRRAQPRQNTRSCAIACPTSMTDSNHQPASTPDNKPDQEATRQLLAQSKRAYEQGDLGRATQTISEAVALSPHDVDLLYWAGVATQAAGNHAKAAEFFARAIQVQPDSATLYLCRGVELAKALFTQAAIEALQRACELDANLAPAWYNLAEALRESGQPLEAIEALQHVDELNPGDKLVQRGFVLAEISAGRIDGAVNRLRIMVRDDPGNAEAWWDLADIKTAPFTSDDVRTMQAMLQRPGLSSQDRIWLGLALGHALEQQGDYAAAFAAFSAANRAQHALVRWSAAAEHKRVEAIVRAFAEPKKLPGLERRGREVIFIASLPRTGSSLVEQILASHPDVTGANELADVSSLLLVEAHRCQAPFPLWVDQVSTTDLEQLGVAYLQSTARWRTETSRCTDKGLRNWLFVGLLLTILPEAKVILVHRDPLETCLGGFRQWFERGSEFTCDLDDMAERCIDFWRLRRFWLERYPDNVLDFSYEQLVASPEPTIRRLLDFCALSFDPACLAFHRTARVVHSAPSSAQVRQPLRHDTARAAHYGPALDGVRKRLREAGIAFAG